MPSTRSNPIRLRLLLAGALVVPAWWLFRHNTEPAARSLMQQIAPRPAASSLVGTLAATAYPQHDAAPKLQETYDAVRASSTALVARQRLAEVRQVLAAMPTIEAAGAIREFL